ncbi:solute carrier family 35 member SLC35F1/F2/F6 [Terfezia claveryi]|nr:solute carrier family 35 member SLC35F1/F2/F6 [Terfezia claveryi]
MFSFFQTKRFWLVLFIGQILALCNTGSSTFSTLLSINGTSIPAFQNIFVYILLCLVFTSYTLYEYGPRKYGQMLFKEGWKYFILAFFDVEGNYFVVLAFRYTTILSAQLINFWAIVVVVIISFFVLKVRYHWAQVFGILVACGGMGLLMFSDHIHLGSSVTNGGSNELKGDLFMLLGATFYGFSNVTEEFLVSKRPLYEVVGQLGLWGIVINGVQAAIFDRDQFQSAVWNGKIGGYIAGFTLCLFTFYTIAPIFFRMSSAAFFNISLLTGNFWGLLIGIEVFHYTIMWLYGVAFTCIVVGLVIYYVLTDVLGESKKPWLGENQEKGVEGVGTAKREISKKVQDVEA